MTNDKYKAALDAIGNANFVDNGHGRTFVDIGRVPEFIARNMMEALQLAQEAEQVRKERDDAISNYETILNLYNKMLGRNENGNA